MRLKPAFWLAGTLLTLAILASLAVATRGRQKFASLDARIHDTVPIQGHQEVSCPEIAKQRPLVLLALGQSNAANHGEPGLEPSGTVLVFAEGKCVISAAPLPGGTGRGGSIWQYLPSHLVPAIGSRPVVLSVIGVDATTIDEWTSEGSPLKAMLSRRIASMQSSGLAPHLILWQQGEADAQRGTDAAAYSAQLDKLEAALAGAGASAQILLARSTVCRSPPNSPVRAAIDSKTIFHKTFRAGPDTDALSGPQFRTDGCHFTKVGMIASARLWASFVALNLQ